MDRFAVLLAIAAVGCGIDRSMDADAGDSLDAASTGDDATEPEGDAGDTSACGPIAGATFGTLTVAGPATDRPAAQHADLNVKLRGWTDTGGALGLIDINGPTDPIAPRFDTLFAPDRVPIIVANHRVNNWDWGTNSAAGPIEDWEVTLTSMQTTPGEVLELPSSGYDIGQGMQALVLYADADSITVKYTREDSIVSGYGIHLVGVCVDPALLALYEQANAAGRGALPALAAGQPFARAAGTAVHIAIRDTGAFLDPRSRKDWWPQ